MSLSPEQAGTVGPSEAHSRWFGEQVQLHDAHLKAYLRGSFPAIRDGDDVVQESYLRVWRRQTMRPIESVRAFLFKVARHLALDTLRHGRRAPIVPVTDLAVLDVIDEDAAVIETVCTNEEVGSLLDAIDRLPGRCREIYILRKLMGVSQFRLSLRGLRDSK